MLEGIYFQFPKLGFVLFFFLACEALCPLRSNPIYFPRNALFGTDETKPPLWMWIAKWAMISFFIVAMMSPVREVKEEPRGYDILLALDPSVLNEKMVHDIENFIDLRTKDRVAIYVPYESPVLIPLSDDHLRLKSIVSQLKTEYSEEKVTRMIERFFSTSVDDRGWAVIISDHPKEFVQSLPVGLEVSVVDTHEDWVEKADRSHPPFMVMPKEKYFEYYYIYPLFMGFLAMLLYLYGRNQKGLV